MVTASLCRRVSTSATERAWRSSSREKITITGGSVLVSLLGAPRRRQHEGHHVLLDRTWIARILRIEFRIARIEILYVAGVEVLDRRIEVFDRRVEVFDRGIAVVDRRVGVFERRGGYV